MADTLCGPSNPLQSFQKHAGVDRTLQQDRLTSRHSPAEGFRSHPGPNAGIQDPVFEAFQNSYHVAGFEPLQSPPYHHAVPQHATAQYPSPSGNGPQGWASDFQQLRLSPPQHFTSHQPMRGQPQHVPQQWGHDFQAQMKQLQPQPSQYQAGSRPYQPRFGGGAYNPGVQQPYGYVPAQEPSGSTESRWKGKGRWQEPEPAQNAAAFDREFEAIESQTIDQGQASTTAQPKVTELGQDVQIHSMDTQTDSVADAEVKGAVRDQIKEDHLAHMQDELQRDATFIHDSIEQHAPFCVDKAHQHNHQARHGDDDLAQIAGELVKVVSDNQPDHMSQQFGNSVFMNFMKQLRDREVHVEDNKMVDSYGQDVSKPLRQCSSSPVLEDVSRQTVQHYHTSTPEFITCKVFGCQTEEMDA
ncbi:MAG: hypothetical protein M1828_004454 [Chrysothrix sp. TS-e1954]|nr:MAG: hypothetical protein M1828_004454 [Chrysothrix sp. TS-e1954]